jgi:excisionase family DNA binding protein
VSLDASEPRGTSQLPPMLAGGLEELLEAIARRVAELQHELSGQGDGGEERSPWLSVSSAAEYLDWPKGRLYKLSARGEIPHYKHEGRLLFRRDELDEWLSRFALGERT